MAQIIKHRRGSLESLSTVTGSLQKGEIVIASGSSNLSVTNGASIVFAVPENGQVQAVNRILVGASAPNTFAAGTYNGMLKGVPYYASGSSTLYLLGEGANEIPNLVGNISEYSSSVSASLSALSASIGSGNIGSSVTQLNTFSGSALGRLSNLETTSASVNTSVAALNTVSASNLGRLSNLETTSASVNTSITALNSSSASQQISIDALNAYTSSNTSTTALNAFTASANERFTEIGVVSGSLIASASAAKTTNDSQGVSITNINLTTASLNTSVAELNSFSSSQLTRNSNLATISGSLISSASAAAIAIANLNANSGSYALLSGSNVFYGTQVITGSLYVTANLIVQGSSSLQNITASAVSIGTNRVILNNDSPAVRFGGISVQDSGSAQGASGSLLWDSLNNNWIYQHPNVGPEAGMTALLISGPKHSGSMGDETHITPGKIMVAVGDDHIGDSIISQKSDNSGVVVDGDLGVSGSIFVRDNIKSDGQIFLQPDSTDTRAIEIYNTGGSDTHIKATGGLTFLGDDSNYVKIDDTAQTVTVRGVNGVFIETGLNVTGPISASAGFSGSIAGIGNVTAYSQSVSASLAAITANVGAGVGVSITNLNSFSSSTLSRLSNIESFSSSVNTKLTEIGVVSGSLIASASTAKSTNDTQDGRLTNLEATSASVNISVSNLNSTTASLNTSVSALNTSSASQQISIDALNVVSGSNLGRLSNLELTSASVNTSVAALNTSSASQQTSIDALNVVSGSNLGRLTNLESKSASVDIAIAALNSYTSSNTSTTALNAFTASAQTRFTEIGVVSGSLIASASNAASRLTTLEGTGTIQGLGTTNEVTFAKVSTTGDVIVGGDLIVQGNTVTLNTSQLVVEDKLLTLASGSTSNATADGAGFEIAGTSASFKYDGVANQFSSSVSIVANTTGSVNLGSAAGSSKRIAFRNTNGNLDLVPTASVAGDLLQWDGTNFVMSNTIDGGSF